MRNETATAVVVNNDESLDLIESVEQVDRLNSAFYSRFPYPPPAVTIPFIADPLLPTRLLNQNLGDFGHRTIAPRCSVWVAGCGTNQALLTALRFPHATVVGSDISPASLAACRQRMLDLGAKNLELREESINGASHREAFDFIICTGVIHHNADPERSLRALAAALAPDGVLELMVYNRFHRIANHAVQRAIRLLAGAGGAAGQAAEEFELANRLTRSFEERNVIGALLRGFRQAPEPERADALVQPIEHSYTVESLAGMAERAGLRLIRPCIDEHSAAGGKYDWNMTFADASLQSAYDALSDLQRWQVTNLLMFERSPMLWFYLQRSDARRRVPSEREVNQRFLDTAFTPVRSTQRYYTWQRGACALAPTVVPVPSRAPEPSVAGIVAAADGRRPMRELLAQLRLSVAPAALSSIRIRTTTSAFPFLLATS